MFAMPVQVAYLLSLVLHLDAQTLLSGQLASALIVMADYTCTMYVLEADYESHWMLTAARTMLLWSTGLYQMQPITTQVMQASRILLCLRTLQTGKLM